MAPVPVYVKGGAWTNVEDQILKAAVQKYGTHQWSKIASLLQKKSGKQCQMRWDEFLNPRLRMGDFTKEEDDKLLDLARKLANQWRTIAEMMDRPAQVCMDRYQILLTHITDGQESGALEYRVGEVNPNAETQVAKPSEEELAAEDREMLAEASARLGNTQGKKATRKIRERLLEDSKRIAQLQKRRELKQSGIDTKISKRKKKYATEIDYNEDIAYEQTPEAGIYDVSEEDQRMMENLQKFHKQVERKGLFDDKSQKTEFQQRIDKPITTKKSRPIISATPQLKADDSILLNEYKKPALSLAAPNDKKAINKRDRKRRKPAFMHLFSLLPKPENNFDIVIESDEETEPETQEITNTVVAKPELLEVPLELGCLRSNSQYQPSPLSHPKDRYELKMNALILNAQNNEQYKTIEDLAHYMGKVEDKINSTQHSIPPVKPVALAYDDNELQAEIQESLSAISETKKDLDYLKPIQDYNAQICKETATILMPEVRRLQHRYFVNYEMYLHELKAKKNNNQL